MIFTPWHAAVASGIAEATPFGETESDLAEADQPAKSAGDLEHERIKARDRIAAQDQADANRRDPWLTEYFK